MRLRHNKRNRRPVIGVGRVLSKGGRVVQPTVEAELAGARRSLAAIASEYQMPVEAARALSAVERTLQRVESTWSRLLPYLLADNAAATQLLDEIESLAPEPVRTDIRNAIATGEMVVDVESVEFTAVNERNELLRALLARVIAALPADAGVQGSARTRIASYLRHSLETRPW